ncbi:Spy/CpxP family protein refolding chaperone [Winogradskyella tangerina]|uniref:Spy/CpxP family protein refolding chaperone n=1 Tax=Winogradskyella tangerina TaxID=2023240 RepID=UPI000DBE2321|nr:Spy/CpxP family protein refolding chaperone [Winogradskyella tangerina]
MKKQLPLYILILFLIIVNGFFLINHFGISDDGDFKGPKGPNNFISKRLDFNAEQTQQFEELEQKHRKTMRGISNEIRSSKEALFDQISNVEASDSKIDSITSVIGEFEKNKDLEVFRHFKAIYNICDDSQKAKFNSLVKDALHKGPPPRGRRSPMKKGNDHPGPPPRH